MLTAIKAVHTALFFSIAAALIVALWDGVTGKPHRRTATAGMIVLVETAVFASNNQVCPLTPLAEQLGADRGSVVDIFLPAAAARRIPLVAGSAALAALVFNARALIRPTDERLSSRPRAQYVALPRRRLGALRPGSSTGGSARRAARAEDRWH